MSRVVRKVLVVLSDISERSASKDLEREMKPLLSFPCVFQVVSDTFIALTFTQKQFYDVIIAPQKVEDPISISTFVECLITADGFSPPFICLLEQGEEEQKFEKAKTVFVRYTDDGGIPINELSTAITSALSDEIPVAQAENVSPCFGGARPARPVMAEAAVVSTEPAARPPKRVRRQAPAASRAKEPSSRPLPHAYPSYPMGAQGYTPQPLHAPQAVQGVQVGHGPPAGPDGHWQAMQWQAQMAFNQHYAPQYMPPPGYPQQAPYYQAPPPHFQQQHHQQQQHPPPCHQPAQHSQHPPVQAPRPVRPQAQEFFHAPPGAQQARASYVPECPMSPTPKARPKKNHRGPVTTTTITYGPPTHTSTQGAMNSGARTSTEVPRSAEDAAVLLPVHKNHQPFSEPLRTPERSPPVPVMPLTGRGRTAEVVFMEGTEEEDADDILQEAARNHLMSPSPVDPDLLNSMFDDAM